MTGETPPGEPYPDGMVTSGDTLSELGRKLGIDGEVLEQTAARFSAHADSGAPIPNLYAVGSCAALTQVGSGYNSGFALGRGLTLAYLAARELRGDPVPG